MSSHFLSEIFNQKIVRWAIRKMKKVEKKSPTIWITIWPPYEHPYEFVNFFPHFQCLSPNFALKQKSSTAFEFGAQLNLDFCL